MARCAGGHQREPFPFFGEPAGKWQLSEIEDWVSRARLGTERDLDFSEDVVGSAKVERLDGFKGRQFLSVVAFDDEKMTAVDSQ